MSTSCRVCLDIESEHFSILEDPTIQLHLKSCLSITISASDNLPKTVCSSCVTQLGNFYHFQLNARCSQDWLESSFDECTKKTTEPKLMLQPLPDSEYNSDSLLEFLNNTANIEEYLSNLGKEDIPSIVNMLDKSNNTLVDLGNKTKLNSPKYNELVTDTQKQTDSMEIDVLDSDKEIVQEILKKETEPKFRTKVNLVNHSCFACKAKFENLHKLTDHVSKCDAAYRTCEYCYKLFDSKKKMIEHKIIHISFPMTCNCGKQFNIKEELINHYKVCPADYGTSIGCVYRCKQCMTIFKSRLQLVRHVKTHIIKATQKVCNICNCSFQNNEALLAHKLTEHKEPEGTQYRCKVCKFISLDRKKIYIHVQKHVYINKSKQQQLCDTCGQSFASLSSFKRHSMQHKKLADSCKMKCKACQANILLEEDEHQCVTEEGMCEHCGETFTRQLGEHECSSGHFL